MRGNAPCLECLAILFGLPQYWFRFYQGVHQQQRGRFRGRHTQRARHGTSGDLIKEFGALGNAVDDYGTDRIGARIIVRLKIKVGSLYYGSEHSVGTETTTIDMPAGTGGT